MTLLVLGPEGTFSHELAIRAFAEEILILPTIHEIFSQVEQGAGDGLVPIENSEAGGVGPTLDGLLQHRVFVTAELYMPVHHYLAGFTPIPDITVLFAHPQTHEQCSRIVNALKVPVIPTSSNAASARELVQSPGGAAAIISRMTADLYKVPILRENVENSPGNTTRFIRISQTRGSDEGCTKCSILVDPEKDQPGLLYQILGIFAERDINLTRIESRPSKRSMGEYLFFIDLACSPACRGALAALSEKSRFRELGCYNEVEVPVCTSR
jgi:prephenate dehydratase